ncbi:NAD(P)(+) transhydrogenase (Re/Si-specific) subunit beta [Carbonactinospora thermoautotrophica]|uniref:NAD(P)(+) transhydrogenase (Re/Si-specific) subunit beta n=1 Tax=Carbonactinospora thermoautotrophica TaxID=1469144 RepID=UPI00226DDA78|nr:NAD(P)(+) transhydrogenase (Re/Si-specific) subunit beta [Carbonactinospora thermoautotrophica]
MNVAVNTAVNEPVHSAWVDLAYLVAAVCFIVALKALSSPKSARWGNLVGAAGAVLAVGVVFASERLDHLPLIIGAIALGTLCGVPAARRVKMTAMPQLVALFNGVGGGAAAIVAIVEFLRASHGELLAALLATVFTVVVGCVSFSGSMVTFAKLQELITTRPIVLPGGRWIGIGTAALTLLLAIAVLVTGLTPAMVLLALAALVLGVLVVLPVGGADVPIVISLLNAFTGLTVAASGYVLGNTLLIVAGTLVGASGTLLTRLMAQAMGRSVTNILFGAFTAAGPGGAGTAEQRSVRSVSPEDVAILLGYARKVVIVPGYGLAVAQAQHTVRELADLLAERGVRVEYGIHPVAGRMPGHMNVLLAEANVPYEQLREMDEINSELPSTDVALVVGANDVVNPAARNSPGSPIYGMPIINVDQAQHVVFLKRSMRPGFSGVENELLYDPKTTLLFGDAKETLAKVVAAVKSL